MSLNYPITVDEIASREAMIFKSELSSMHSRLVSDYLQSFNRFWHNPDPALTPAVMAAKLGTHALDVFTKSAMTVAFLNSIVPGSISVVIPNAYAFDAAGNIIIGEPITQ